EAQQHGDRAWRHYGAQRYAVFVGFRRQRLYLPPDLRLVVALVEREDARLARLLADPAQHAKLGRGVRIAPIGVHLEEAAAALAHAQGDAGQLLLVSLERRDRVTREALVA